MSFSCSSKTFKSHGLIRPFHRFRAVSGSTVGLNIHSASLSLFLSVFSPPSLSALCSPVSLCSGTRGAWRGGQRRRQKIAGSYCLVVSVKGRHCSSSMCDPRLRSARHWGQRYELNGIPAVCWNAAEHAVSHFLSGCLKVHGFVLFLVKLDAK